ncbi:MAG: serine/threonine-protein kinase [Caldilineaceae bacterium]
MPSSIPSATSSVGLPTQVGSYQIESLLGEGAAGIVYRARRIADGVDVDVNPPEWVALKLLKPETTTQPQVVACFQFEGRILSRLSHPGILRVYETGLDNGQMFTAMELIEGESLDRYLSAKKRLSVAEAIHLARQLAEALDYLHSHGYAHRDIKPANLMHSSAGRLVLFDFGTAIRIKDGNDYEAGLYGTPAYLAPEQIENYGEIDGRVDLYALGIMLYLMVTGRKPFYGTRDDVLQAHLSDQPPLPTKYARMPQALEAAILKALAKQPAERFDTGAAFAAALAEIEANLPPTQPSLWQKLTGWLRPTASLLLLLFIFVRQVGQL